MKRTMKFPPSVNPATGRFEEADRRELIRQSVYIILKTAKGERPFAPDFGSNLKEYIFTDINRTELNIMERDIRRSILAFEPDIEQVWVSSRYIEKENKAEITIRYTIRDMDMEDVVTVPLYIGGSYEGSY